MKCKERNSSYVGCSNHRRRVVKMFTQLNPFGWSGGSGVCISSPVGLLWLEGRFLVSGREIQAHKLGCLHDDVMENYKYVGRVPELNKTLIVYPKWE